MITNLLPGDPREVGPYRLLGRLGQGGMGVVYLARSPGGRQVAVKVIRPEYANEPGFRARFTREVTSARGVSGMFTALVVDADTSCPTPWFATAYVPGQSLYEAVETSGPLPAATVLQLAAGLAEGLQAIHAAGVIHRDLKPSNVLLAADGPRVIDFGISKAREASMLTQTGMVMGSPGYLSPEQAEGTEVGPSSDIFSLGGVLTYALTGQGPFGSGPTPALMFRVVSREPDLTRVPDLVRPVIERCLRKDPAARPTPDELLAELDALGAGVGVVTPEWLPYEVTSQIARYVPTALTPVTPSRPAATTSDASLGSGTTSDAGVASGTTSESAQPVADTPSAAAAELAGAGIAGPVIAGPVVAGPVVAGDEEAEAADAGAPAESGGIPLTPAGVEAASAVAAPDLAGAGVAGAAIAGADLTSADRADADRADADRAEPAVGLGAPALAGSDVAGTRTEAAAPAAGLAAAGLAAAGVAAGATGGPPAVTPAADLTGAPSVGDQHDLTFAAPAGLAADVGGLATIGLASVRPSGGGPVVGDPVVGGPVLGGPVRAGGPEPATGGPVPGGPGGPGGPVLPPPRRPWYSNRRLILAAAAAIVILAGVGIGAGLGLAGGSGTGKATGGPVPTVDVNTTASHSARATRAASTKATATKKATTKKATTKRKTKPAEHTSSPTPPVATTTYVAPTTPISSPTTYISPTTQSSPTQSPTHPATTPATTQPASTSQAWGGASGAGNYGANGSCTGPESSAQGASTSYSFYNGSNASISLAYYTPTGGYMGYGSVAAHQTAGVSTYVGYFWVVTGANGSCLGEIQVQGPGQATVVS